MQTIKYYVIKHVKHVYDTVKLIKLRQQIWRPKTQKSYKNTRYKFTDIRKNINILCQ